MNRQQDYTEISKFLSFVLRHKPEAINLTLNDQGWASVAELIEKAKPILTLTPKLIRQVVIDNDKNRFSLSSNKQYIRANQGHSVKIDLKLIPKKPPAVLYHGTATRFLDSIKREGLNPGQRNHVHLSLDIETATAVGKRYGKVVVLEISADAMHQQKFKFFLSENNVWLTESVPANFLSVIA